MGMKPIKEQLQYVVWGSDRYGRYFNKLEGFADDLNEISETYRKLHPTICHINIDAALPYPQEAVNG